MWSSLVRVYVDCSGVFLGVGFSADEEDESFLFGAVEADDPGDFVVEVGLGDEVVDGDLLVGFYVVDVGVVLGGLVNGGT